MYYDSRLRLLQPILGRCLLASQALGCSEEMLTVVAMATVQHIWAAAPGAPKLLVGEAG